MRRGAGCRAAVSLGHDPLTAVRGSMVMRLPACGVPTQAAAAGVSDRPPAHYWAGTDRPTLRWVLAVHTNHGRRPGGYRIVLAGSCYDGCPPCTMAHLHA